MIIASFFGAALLCSIFTLVTLQVIRKLFKASMASSLNIAAISSLIALSTILVFVWIIGRIDLASWYIIAQALIFYIIYKYIDVDWSIFGIDISALLKWLMVTGVIMLFVATVLVLWVMLDR